MSSIGFEIASDENALVINRMRERLKDLDAQVSQENTNQEKRSKPYANGPFQKALAWVSYFVLLFVAYCVFLPIQTAAAADIAICLAIDCDHDHAFQAIIDGWSLRDGSGIFNVR